MLKALAAASCRAALAACLVLATAATIRAQEVTGDTLSIPVARPTGRAATLRWTLTPDPSRLPFSADSYARLPARVGYSIASAPGVVASGKLSGRLDWNGRDPLSFSLKVEIPSSAPAGLIDVGTLSLEWPGVDRFTLTLQARVESQGSKSHISDGILAASSVDLELAVLADVRDVPAGGALPVRYIVTNYTDAPEQVRFSLDPGSGWRVLDPGDKELPVEAGEDLEGVLMLQAPAEARIGTMQRVRILVGNAALGASEAFVSVRIAKAGTRTDIVQLPVSLYAAGAGINPDNTGTTEVGASVDITGSLTRQTRLTASYVRGPRQDIPPSYRLLGLQTEPRLRVGITNPGWIISLGEVYPQSNTLTTYARGDGVAVRKTRGRLVGNAIFALPKDLGTGVSRGGRIAQGAVGVNFGPATVTLLASDVVRPARPLPGTVVTTTTDAGDRTISDLEQLSQFFPQESQVRGYGVEASLAGWAQRLTVTAGRRTLSNAAGQRSEGLAGAVRYSVNTRRFSANFSGQRMPPSLPGVYIAGNTMSADGSLRVAGPLRVTVRGYSNASWLYARDTPTRSEGASAGLRWAGTGRLFVDVQANHRESIYTRTWTSRSASTNIGLRMGTAMLSGGMELGETDDGLSTQRLESYRGALSVASPSASLTLSTNYYQYGTQRPTARTDLRGSVGVGAWRFEGGGGLGRGGIFGTESSGWLNVDVPVGGGFWLVTGVEHFTWRGDSPYLAALGLSSTSTPWRFTVGFRQRLSLPLAFLRAPGLSPPAAPR